MSDKNKNSRKRYKEFVRERGFFKFKKKANADNKDKEKSDRDDYVSKMPVRYYLLRYIREFKGQKSRLLLIIFIGMMISCLGAVFPWTSKVMIDYILPQKNAILLFAACLALLLNFAVQIAIYFVRDYVQAILHGTYVLDLQRRLMGHLQTLPLIELQKLKVGGIIARLQEDTEGAGNLLFNALLGPMNALIMASIAVTSLLLVNWKVMMICLFFCSIMCFISYVIFNVMRPFQRSLRQDKSMINANLTESFGGVQVVRSFRRESTVKREYGIGVDLLWRKSLYSFVIGSTVYLGAYAVRGMTEISIWVVGGYYFINGTMSLGSLVVFVSFISWLFQPIFMLMSSFSEMQKSLACVERTFDLMDMKADIVDKQDASGIRSFQEGVRFHAVTFKYPDGTAALHNIELFIPKGKTVALVGPSGAGKTTLTNLVLRFYDVTEGRITVDGQDIRNIKLTSYRRLMSLVLQDVFLFDGTVRENIMFGKKDASMVEVERAAKVAHCDEFVGKLKDKYDTIIGERGVKLSGGQKQRLALARAVIAEPQLLILDEATSNLDSESEGLIQDALRHIFKDRTTIVIAHRLSTIVDANLIVVVDKGLIMEQGTHTELLERRGKYYEMYEKQMGKYRTIQNIWDAGAGENGKDNS